VRHEREVALEIRQRGAEALELLPEQASVAELSHIVGLDPENAFGAVEGGHPFAAARMGVLQIAEHPHHHLARARGCQPLGREASRLAQRPLEQCFTVLHLEQGAVERIDDERGLSRGAQQEVPREGNALELETDARGDLAVDDRERDRDSGAALENDVEKAVARVVVLLLIAAEAGFAAQERDEPRHAGRGVPCAGNGSSRVLAEPVQCGERYVRIERRLELRRQHQGRIGEPHRFARAQTLRELAETGGRRVRLHAVGLSALARPGNGGRR
jgi:hypothetical protein